MTLFRRLALSAAGFALAGAARVDQALGADRPVLIELFTSQGCNSCPPADALLGELARRPGILALAFHVDYWNGLGWKDPFSSHDATTRQHDYAQRLGKRSIYTPQLVVDGAADAVGSDRDDVDALIAAARRRAASGPSIEIVRDEAGGRIARLGAGAAARGTVWLAGYDRSRVTPVGRGENGGRTLTEYQVVRSLVRLGDWTGTASQYAIPDLEAEGAILFVQPDQPGPMLAALDITG
ncbi:MAG TPA: DUF1223 domain-containing protein [Aliidongia sp.]|uniref:DUF1223 domain-containing protein n=1 Tax=Aliidongia sp. TaxID=1914230 RepID=UPI002DDCA9F9|nr:DUF1223 domain-containing protein [Aliidongia sp.]HEV2678273.1 DUF1223 domain-containing protein [Aliidongia sp.]